MKRKYAAIVLGFTLSASLLSGCGTSTAETTEIQTGTIYGEVSSIDGDTITIDVEAPKEVSDSAAGSAADSDSKETTAASDSKETTADTASSSDAPALSSVKVSDLESTGETQEIEVTDDTEIVRQSMGGMGSDMSQGGGMGGTGDMGQGTGQAPSGDASGQAPSGDAGQGGTDGSTDGTTPPEIPSGDANGQGGQAPSGDAGQGGTDGTTPPEIPSGDASQGGQAPSGDAGQGGQAPSGDMGQGGGMGGAGDMQIQEEDITIDDISEGDTIEVDFNDDGQVEKITVLSDDAGMGQGGGGSAVTEYTAVNEYSEDTELDGETVESTGTDENAILVDGDANVTLKNMTVTRESDSSTGGDNSSFYGVGAAILGTKGTTTISDSTITTNAAGGAGVFAYGDAVVKVSDTTITTKQDTSGGIHAAGGGTLYAENLDVTTNGESSAAIRSDRGGGKMVIDGGTYTSNGTGSPAIYSTADIAATDAALTANGSEAICIEGLNSIHLFNSDLTGNMSDSDQNDCTWNVILYQSMSGDAEEGNSTFEMDGGTLTAKNGGMFYTTNTESTFILNDVDINYAAENPFFLRCTGNSNARGWGSSGANGADCNFTAISQNMEGNIIWDSISNLDFYITDGSLLTGAIVDDESCAGNGGNGYCNVYIDKNSTWTVTQDSTLSNLSCAGTITDEEGNQVTIKGTDGTVYVEGTSSYTITVTNYDTNVDVSGASQTTTFADYQ